MKTCLILEDTPKGLYYKLIWQPNGHQDNVQDAISMNVQRNFALFLMDMQSKGLLRVIEGAGDKPSPMHQPTA